MPAFTKLTMILGLICALVLMILDVPIEAIEYDYTLSEQQLLPELEHRIKEVQRAGLTPDWASIAPEMIQSIKSHLDTHHGGLIAYMDSIGFGQSQRDRLRETLLY